jgi:hypothetical protein
MLGVVAAPTTRRKFGDGSAISNYLVPLIRCDAMQSICVLMLLSATGLVSAQETKAAPQTCHLLK